MYRVVAGDTLDAIARKIYGDGAEAVRLREANPGITDPPAVGSVIAAPIVITSSAAAKPALSIDPDEVALLIDGRRFRSWTAATITRSIDSMDTIDISAPFDADRLDLRTNFRPFSFPSLIVTAGGEPLFSGTMVNVLPVLSTDKAELTASGYALPGVLNDCTPPASMYPIEFEGLTLRAIADRMLRPFGLRVDAQGDTGAPFDRVACEPGKKVLDFLAELSRQRGLVLASNPAGGLVIWRSEMAAPVAVLRQGESPLLSVTPAFDAQQYYSSITGIEPVLVGLRGSQYTVRNTRAAGIVRPLTYTVQDGNSGDVPDAVQAKMGRMFGGAVSYSCRVSTWRDPLGQLWSPNTTLRLHAPDAMVYKPFDFIVRSVTFEVDATARTATLSLVLPGAYSGEIPEELPWDE